MFVHAMEKLKKGKGCKFIMMQDITEQVVHKTWKKRESNACLRN